MTPTKPIFIELTIRSNEDDENGKKLNMNIHWIRSIEETKSGGSLIEMMGGSRGNNIMRGAELWVHESPKQIMDMIKEATE